MVMDIIKTHCDHFATYTDMKPLCCIPETNILLFVNYTSN